MRAEKQQEPPPTACTAFHLKHVSAAIRSWRHLAQIHSHATDAMLHAASYLAMTPRPRSQRYGRVGGMGFGLFAPPLQKLQALDGHGRIYFAEPHRSAALAMLQQRGGIGTMRVDDETRGLAEGMQW